MQTSIKSKQGTFILDCVTNEQHTSKMRITENPVESGASVADHAILEPKELAINGVIVSYQPSNYAVTSLVTCASFGYQLPIEIRSITAQAEQKVNQASVFIDKASSAEQVADFLPSLAPVFSDSTSSNRLSKMLDQMLALQRNAETLTVQTQTKQYENMLITSIAVNQSTANSLEVSLNLKEIFVVELQVASGLDVDQTRNTQTQNLGRTQPQESRSGLLSLSGRANGL